MTTSPTTTAPSARGTPFTRGAAAALVRESRDAIYAGYGLKAVARGAFPYLLGRMVDGIAASLDIGGPANVFLTYQDWADLANARTNKAGKRKIRAVRPGSLRAAFTSHATAVEIPGRELSLVVEIQTPGVRGTEARHGQVGMTIRFLRKGKDILPSGDPPTGAVPLSFAEALEEARALRKMREAMAEGFRDFERRTSSAVPRAAARLLGEFTTDMVLLLRNYGIQVKASTALVLFLAVTLVTTVGVVSAATIVYHRLFPQKSQYLPIPEERRPTGPPLATQRVVSDDVVGTLEYRYPTPTHLRITFVPEKLPAPTSLHPNLRFEWWITEHGKPTVLRTTSYPQVDYELSKVPTVDELVVLQFGVDTVRNFTFTIP